MRQEEIDMCGGGEGEGGRGGGGERGERRAATFEVLITFPPVGIPTGKVTTTYSC